MSKILRGFVGQGVAGFVKAAGQLLGTNTNDSAEAGFVGEYMSQSRVRSAASALTTATSINVTATPLTLTPGDWSVTAMVGYDPDQPNTNVSVMAAGLSLTSATLPALDVLAVPTANEAFSRIANVSQAIASDTSINIPSYQVTVATGTTVVLYLVANASFSGSTLSAYGSMRARRVR